MKKHLLMSSAAVVIRALMANYVNKIGNEHGIVTMVFKHFGMTSERYNSCLVFTVSTVVITIFSSSLCQLGAPVAQWVKRWPSDLAVVSSSLV